MQERMNGFQDLLEQEANEQMRRRNSQELLSALEEVQMKRRLSQIFEECQSEQDVCESLELCLSAQASRRGSLDPEPTSLDDPACLQRAVSCESVCSDTSVVLNDLEPGAEDGPVVGLVCVGLEHDR